MNAINEVVVVADRSGAFERVDGLDAAVDALGDLPGVASTSAKARRGMEDLARAATAKEARGN
ncbi:MAG: hypothetical protein ACJ78Z_16100 [Myxococcales bacterium]